MPGGPGSSPPNNPTKTTMTITRHPCYAELKGEPRATHSGRVPKPRKHKKIKALLAFRQNIGHNRHRETAALRHFALPYCGVLTIR
jgi:hypothetical protein